MGMHQPLTSLTMGNINSCIPKTTGRPTAQLVSPDGRVRHVGIPTSAVELMLDAPGHVVARRGEPAGRGRRVVGMPADEQLVAGEVYLLLPKSGVGSGVDGWRLELVATAAAGIDVFGGGAGTEEQVEVIRRGRFCHWKPFLDTIDESSLEVLTLHMLMQMDTP